MKAAIVDDMRTTDSYVQVSLNQAELQIAASNAYEYALQLIAKAIADRFIADHLQDILKMLDPQAVANLAVAESAASIRETLHKKLPDKIVEVVRTDTQVFQRGILGGLTRIR